MTKANENSAPNEDTVSDDPVRPASTQTIIEDAPQPGPELSSSTAVPEDDAAELAELIDAMRAAMEPNSELDSDDPANWRGHHD